MKNKEINYQDRKNRELRVHACCAFVYTAVLWLLKCFLIFHELTSRHILVVHVIFVLDLYLYVKSDPTSFESTCFGTLTKTDFSCAHGL